MTPEKIFRPINPQVHLGHVHLKVADLDRSLAFYRDVLGFEITQRIVELPKRIKPKQFLEEIKSRYEHADKSDEQKA